MRFAISNDQRIEATPGAQGVYPSCNADMLARCGTKKVWHWAHKGRRHCDHWWENETQWHRDWKNRFPNDWQEISARDNPGELHIADLKTPYGLVIEFQHSAIKLEEVEKRTKFYDQVIWIIDANHRPTDRLQYERMLSENYPERFGGVDIYTVFCEETRLLKEWGSLDRFVGFDFGGDTLCLLTAAQGRNRYLFDFPKVDFLGWSPTGNHCRLFNSENPPSVVIVAVADSSAYWTEPLFQKQWLSPLKMAPSSSP